MKKTFLKKLTALFKEEGVPMPEGSEPLADEMSDLQDACDKLALAIATYGDGAGLPADHPLHALKALHSSMTEKLGARATAKAEADKLAAAPKEEDDDVIKTANTAAIQTEVNKALEPVQKALIAAEKRAADAETIAKSERDLREVEGEKATLRKFRHVTVDVDKDAAMFAKMRAADKPAYDFMIAKLNAAEAVAKVSNLLERDLGSPLGGGGQTAWAEIEAKAAEIVTKGAAGMTQEKAIDQVMKRHPELVTRYKADQAGSPS